MKQTDFFLNANMSYIKSLYKKYLDDKSSIDSSWKSFFDSFQLNLDDKEITENSSSNSNINFQHFKELKVYKLIENYRRYGHLKSNTNPIRPRIDYNPPLNLEDVDLDKEDLNSRFSVSSYIGLKNASLYEIIEKLKKIYLGTIGFEYSYIHDKNIYNWLQNKIEIEKPKFSLSIKHKKRILEKLNEAEIFEHFIHTKYIGQKRFSLEGGENLIPLLDFLIYNTSSSGSKSAVIGMAHRGRLNVLANIIGKTYEEIFQEFEGNVPDDMAMGDGDVKYHKGFSNMISTIDGSKIAVEIVPNPSHLEVVNPLVIGYVQAKGNSYFQGDFNKILPILIHGDSAIAGQGIGYEVAQMSSLPGYDVGGIVHIVINNQLGFTTDYTEARSSFYCTDLAKITDAPVIHVNGDDVEEVIFAASMAIDYRNKFGKDIFIDLLCYRKYGHNESDEPRFTQPTFYKLIENHPNPREIYKNKLLKNDSLDSGFVSSMEQEFKKHLQERLNYAKQNPLSKVNQFFDKEWEKLRFSRPEDFISSPDTSISENNILKVADSLVTMPSDFKPIKQITRLLQDRKRMFFEDKVLNWASGELLAYGSLLLEGYRVRICGQDSERGTFSHRHAVIRNSENDQRYCFLENLKDSTGTFCIFNSILSEYAVLGVQYGYAMANPTALVIWEAQFGDFANGAQVVIDQFISSAESKWQKMVGIVLLLPHGYEGQGPEHSSARLERFLQMSAEYNMVVANVTTPANFCHLLRRQMKWPFRKPLVVMSPKSLLRHPKVVSSLDDFTTGSFKEIIDDFDIEKSSVRKVILCSGKIYYDLLKEREDKSARDVAIVRIEQLYPFSLKQFKDIASSYGNANFVWVQEEPSNMGAWFYISRILSDYNLELISRKESASPAVGYLKLYKTIQKTILEKSFE